MLHALPDTNRQLQVKKFFGIGLRNVRWKTGEINFKWKTVKTFFSPSYFQIMAFKFRSNSRTFLPSGWDTACQVSAVMRWMSWERTCTFLFFRAVPEDFWGGM